MTSIIPQLMLQIGKKAVSKAVTICPAPNLAFLSEVFRLQEMVDHIYGRFDALTY